MNKMKKGCDFTINLYNQINKFIENKEENNESSVLLKNYAAH